MAEDTDIQMELCCDKEITNSCVICRTILIEPYIRCAECDVEICLHCFGRGSEIDGHKNYHDYEVVRSDFVMFDNQWTAAEEMRLLTAIADFGIGNWANISRQVQTKNKLQCENHYINYYIDNAKYPLPCFTEKDTTKVVHPTPVMFKLCEDPPRPPEGSSLQNDMSGYQAARGDFFTEYDNFAELDIMHLDLHFEEDEDTFEYCLKLAVFDIYRNCLKGRYHRKKIISNYGLISQKKLVTSYQQYEKVLGDRFNKLRVFMRLMNPVESDKFIESLAFENELQNAIRRLQQYYNNGVTNLQGGKVFDRLKKRRREEREKRHCLKDVITYLQDETACKQWLQRHSSKEGISKGMPAVLPSAPRRNALPLNVSELPGNEKLTAPERELCSTARIVPDSYLEFKKILMTECSKSGFIRLAQARTLLKIDVNKTRKLFDFLLEQGLITKDSI